MDVKLRPGTPEDAEVCGPICFEAFGAIAGRHGFPPDFPDPEAGIGLLLTLLSNPGVYSVVAEVNGEVVGSNFLDERSAIAGVGPITVAPDVQDHGVGRILMQDVLRRAADRNAPGVRLLQAAYHNRSLSLYAKLGFQVRDLLACLQGSPPQGRMDGYRIRHATATDADACNTVCRRVHGHDRAGEVRDAIVRGTALVVEHDERITGYSTDMGFLGHAVGEGNEELKALIMAAQEFGGPGILVPTTNAPLFRWCLERGLQVVQLMTLMSTGLYNRPDGAYLPSVLY
jgi:predicted N-acetyltransferase YhbS